MEEGGPERILFGGTGDPCSPTTGAEATPLALGERILFMDQAPGGRKNLAPLMVFATVLQMAVMILLATDRITTDVAVPMLGGVLIVGLLPALAASRKPAG